MKLEVVLRHQGTEYKIVYEAGFDDEEVAEFWWDDGNGSCDCNRSLKIQQHCDPNFPELDCGGEEIDLISVKVLVE